jgi:hypothetical protein
VLQTPFASKASCLWSECTGEPTCYQRRGGSAPIRYTERVNAFHLLCSRAMVRHAVRAFSGKLSEYRSGAAAAAYARRVEGKRGGMGVGPSCFTTLLPCFSAPIATCQGPSIHHHPIFLMMNSWTRHGAWRGYSTSQFVAVVAPLGLLDGAGGLRYRGALDQGFTYGVVDQESQCQGQLHDGNHGSAIGRV